MNVYKIMTDAELKHIIDVCRGKLVHNSGLSAANIKSLKRDYVGGFREIKRRQRRGNWTLHSVDVVWAEESFETPYILYPYMTLYRKGYRLHPDEATARRYVDDRKDDYYNTVRLWEWDEKKSAWVKL